MTYKIVLNGREIFYELTQKQVKNINLRVRRDATICVSASPRVSLARIERFMQENAARILSAIDQAKLRNDLRSTSELLEDGCQVYYLGNAYRLRVCEGIRNEVRQEESTLVLSVKNSLDPALRKKTFEKWMAEQCREQIGRLCRQIYPYFKARGISYPLLRFRFMKTRWGSCNAAKGILTFNCHLAEKPIEAIEYVVAHEFTHFLHCDHSKRFYNELEKVMPDWKIRKKLLNA